MSSATPFVRPSVNRQFVLASRPTDLPDDSTFRMVTSPVPELQDGELLVRAIYLSVDPYMRGRLREGRSYAAPVEVGGIMVGGGAGRVIESKNPDFGVGEIVEIYMGWQEYAISNGKGLRKLHPSVPVPVSLGVLGATGLTAYFGLLDVCDPKPGETVVVSGAAGATGSVVGQIAKIKGCRTVGIAGSAGKVDWIKHECGFDEAFDYKTTPDYSAKLQELCPKGIDVYFDNVGGPITDAVLPLINTGARIAICGQISQYNNSKPQLGPRLLHHLIIARAKMQGFLVTDYAQRFAAAGAELASWYLAGRLKSQEDIVEGFENLPRAFIGLFKGENTGKRLVKID